MPTNHEPLTTTSPACYCLTSLPSLHKLALDVARANRCDSSTLAGIHQRWGDHLYVRGEYDAAMMQYLETIGVLEPSYVIRR